VFWIDISSVTSVEAGYIYLAQQAGVGTTWMAGKYWLSECVRPWLLVLDNADDPQLDLTKYIPTGSLGHILITTRIRDFRTYATVGHLKFDKMEPEEAIDLLLKAAYPDDLSARTNAEQRSIAKDIAKALGHLAIALNQAGATVRQKIYTLEKYLRSYLGTRNRLLNSRSIPPEERDVITTWEIPFRRVETTQSVESRDAADLMHIFAFLHFESIPEILFHQFWTKDPSHTPTPGEIRLLVRVNSCSLDEGEARFRRAIRVLSEFSIVDYDPTKSTCSLHPVVHEWAQSRISDDQKMVFWLKRTLDLVSRCAKLELADHDHEHRRSILPHADSCSELIFKRAPAIFQTSQGADQAETLASLYEVNGCWYKALALLKVVSSFRRTKFGRRHERFLEAQCSISRCHWNLFEVKSALDVQSEIIKARWWLRPSLMDWLNLMRVMKPEHLSYCLALDDLTQTLWLMGLRDMSKYTGQRAVRGMEKQLDQDDPRLWSAMFNLGRTLRHLGDLANAHQLLRHVVMKRKIRFGPKHPETLMARNELGMSFWSRKQRLDIAEKIVANVLEARKTVLGRDHAYTLWSVNDLSKILCTRGRAAEAAQSLEEIIPTVEATLGKQHVGMIMTKGNLARANAFCGRWVEAKSVLLDILNYMDEDHPNWFECMYGYVRAETELACIAQAEAGCQKILQKVMSGGEKNPKFRSTVELLGNVYYRSTQHEKLSQLKTKYAWINEKNIERPPLLL